MPARATGATTKYRQFHFEAENEREGV